MKKVLVTCDMPDSFLLGLNDLDYSVDYRPELTTEEVISRISSYHGLIVSTPVKVSAPLIDQASQLRFVGRAGSGMENIDEAYAGQKGIVCFNSPEGNRNAVAEHALGMLLALLNNIVRSDNEVRKGMWSREVNRGRELAGLTVGIIGFGNTGSTFAQKLRGMDVRIQAYDKYVSGFGGDGVEEVNLNHVLREADVISLHVPLTRETHHLVNDEFLSQCQKPVILINTSRGKVVETGALARALKSGKVVGTCLDVLEQEPPGIGTLQDNDPLKELAQNPSVIFTPHIAGWSVESRERIGQVLLDKIARIND